MLEKVQRMTLLNSDVKDKLVLIDINQREEWWINYPAYQAYLQGAAAVIAVQEGGYSEVDPTCLECTRYRGPDYAPAFSMSQVDAEVLKTSIAASGNPSCKSKF